jgi:hypothetical protein
MSVRRRAAGWQLAQVLGFLLLAAVVIEKDWQQLIVVPLAWAAAVWVWRLQTLRCPNCGKPIYLRTPRLFGATWTYWSPTFPKRHCTRCGFDLSAPLTISPVRDQKRREERSVGLRLRGALSPRHLLVILLGGIAVNLLTTVWIIVFGVSPGNANFVMWGRLAGALASGGAIVWLATMRCRRCSRRLGRSVFANYCWSCHQDLRQL